MIRVVAIDDHHFMLEAIDKELSACTDIALVGTADHGAKLFDLVHEHLPDVVILDLLMARGDFEPISAVRELRQTYPNMQVLILTASENPMYIRKLTKGGARGYIIKSDGPSFTLPEAVRKLVAGEKYYSATVVETLISDDELEQPLNSREMDVLCLMGDHIQYNSIADILGLAESRIRNIVSSIYTKMGIQEQDESGNYLNQRGQLLDKARQMGLLPKKKD